MERSQKELILLGGNELKLHGIEHLFVSEQLLDKQQALQYSQYAAAQNISLVQYLVTNDILLASQIAQIVSESFGVPMLDLDCIEVDSISMNHMNENLIRRHSMIPLFSRGTNLYLATEDPSKQGALKEIQFHTGLNAHAIVVETHKLHALIKRLLATQENQHLFELVADTTGFDEFTIDENQEEHTTSMSLEDAPIVKFVNKILFDAMNQGASDIHFEPYEKNYRIRYRQDGILHEIGRPSGNLAPRISARIKVLSRLDTSEKRIPQDGGFKIKSSKTSSIECRVSICPTIFGEKVVIRLLDPNSTQLKIEALGFSSKQKKQFIQSLARPQGMILVTGPTGSGKSNTLYSALNILNTEEVNISSAEDPVEIKIPGINQVNINPKTGLNFSSALRSFLRQDPDIIMVGEIRDLETAEIAVKAAQTGHLVLSTLHTNSAAETLNRLVNMGIAPFNVASSVSLIIAQRLARKLCEQCKTLRDDLASSTLLDLGFVKAELMDLTIYKAVGCDQCTNGYKGRIGLFEVLPMSSSLTQTILSGGNSLDILKIALEEGMSTIYLSGLEKVKQGLTTIEEINRLTVD